MNSLIVNKAVESITEAHAGQTRWDGSPYVGHPIAVMKITFELIKNEFLWEDMETEIAITALGHDLEDTKWNGKEKEFVEYLEKLVSPEHIDHRNIVIKSLQILNKHNHKNYFEYIIACSCDNLARIVKMADLTHNLIDSKPGSLRDKYMLALHILETAG